MQGTSSSHDTTSDEILHPDSPHGSPALSPAMQRLQTGLESLKYQHSALVQVLHMHPEPGPSLRSSPLLATAKEEEELHTPSTYSTLGKASTRSHRLSSHSEASIWYDAPEYDGAEEFILDESPAEDTYASKISDVSSPSAESSTTTTDAEFSNDWDSETDTEEGTSAEPPEQHSTTSVVVQSVVRRTQLPCPPVGDEGSLFTVLKKNVGKVSPVSSFPIIIIEVTTLCPGSCPSCITRLF